MQEQSQDKRLEMLNLLLTCPHRNLEAGHKLHSELIQEDPLFYTKLAAWYFQNGEIRDFNELFVTNLCLYKDNEMRDVGLALMSSMAPYQVCRIVDFVHGKYDKKLKKVTGLRKNVPGSMKTEIERYLKDREADNAWFDSSVLNARKYLKRLYGLLHIAPSERAQAILFDENPPEDSSAALVKELAKLNDPSEQARLIIDRKVPYRVASTIVKNMTPTVLLALIEVMSPQELINNMGSLRKHGVFDNPDLKGLVETKLKGAESSKKVSALKAVEAAKAAGLSDDLNEALQNVADKQVKSKGRISRATALLIDKSASMNVAIEIGKQMASMISAVMADGVPFYCHAFDVMTYPIKAKGSSLNDWAEALKHIRASNGTCCGAPMVYMEKNNQVVEQIVMITDEGENTPPAFLKSYESYCDKMKVKPSVHMLRCGSFYNSISDKLERAGVELSKYDIKGAADYYSLPGIVQYLTRPGRLELLMDIMSWPLPERRKPKEKDVVTANS